MHKRLGSRIGPIAAIIGPVLLFVGTFLHPMDADPNIPMEAFAEYAADRHWVASHLIQLSGALLMMAALVLLYRRLVDGPGAEWATLGVAGAVASMAMASVLQAVDGIALKAMVDRWAAAPEPERSALFQATLGVRQVEIGLAGIASLIYGLTVWVYGMAFVVDGRFPRWVGAPALVGGALLVISGVAVAYAGFSDLAMLTQMAGTLPAMVWLVGLGIYGWSRPLF